LRLRERGLSPWPSLEFDRTAGVLGLGEDGGGRRPLAWRLGGSWGVAVGLGVLSALLRLPRALSSPFWQDEVASARVLREPGFLAMLHRVGLTESTPPLWYTVAWLTHRSGVSIHDVRLLSVVANGLAVALVVVLAGRSVPPGFAVFAGAVVAFGGEFSAQGRWLRAYELFALLAVVFAVALLRAAAKASWFRMAALTVATGAGCLTHYFFFFTVAAAVGWLLLEPRLRPVRTRLLLAVVGGLLPLVFWLPSFVRQFERRRYAWVGSFRWRLVLETPLRLFTPLLGGWFGIAAAVLVIAALTEGAVALCREGLGGRLCVVLAAGPWAIAGLTWAAGVHVYSVRNMIGIGPFVAVGVAMALARLPRRAGAVAAGAVVLAAVVGFAWSQGKVEPPFDRLAHSLVAQGWQQRDTLAVFGNVNEFRSPLEWYLPPGTRLHQVRRPQIGSVVYLVAGPRAAARLPRASLHRVGRFFVGRLRLRSRAEHGDVLSGATFLDTSRS
jgi:hypothetical protein